MRALDVDAIEKVFASAPVCNDADYSVLGEVDALRGTHLAISRQGFLSLLLPIAHVASETIRLTHGIALRGAPQVEFTAGAERWCVPAAVIECRDRKLARTFAAMIAAFVFRLDEATLPTWERIVELFSEWERLLGRRYVLSGEAELGLWAELWCLVRTTRQADLLAGWRGPDAERVDFLIDGHGFEVKASRRVGIHEVSQSQVEGALEALPVVLVSLFVMQDPLRGRTIPELVRAISSSVSDLAAFEEKLAAVGYSRDDDAAYRRRLALMEVPRLYDMSTVPRVRAADPGVTQLRYRVELQRDTALDGPLLQSALTAFGLDPTSYEYPCA